MSDKYVVTVENQGAKFWLRGTTWAFRVERANVFETAQAATDAAKKAEKFMARAIRKNYRVEPA